MSQAIAPDPWEQLDSALAGPADGLQEAIDRLPPEEIARALSRLEADKQRSLLTQIAPDRAARLIDALPEAQAADLLETLPPAEAASILNHIASDEQADLVGNLDAAQAEAVVQQMAPEEADDVRHLSRYPAESAGGLMITEYLAYPDTATVADVITDLRQHAKEYSRYDSQYVYVTSDNDALLGVLRLRELLLAPEEARVTAFMIPQPRHVRADAGLDELHSFFDRHSFFGVPVVDSDNTLVGVVLRSAVEEALGEQANQALLRFSGLIGGEEFRTMPLRLRVLRRLAWLGVSIVLNLIAASIVGLFQETLAAVIALAVFLPVISGMGGSSGNQALAVSLRELSLGLIKPYEVWWVIIREASVGALNGLALGTFLAGIAFVWIGNPYFGLVVGGALALTTIVAVCLGGSAPLLLKLIGLDPALAAGPMVMTLTDMCGFFAALGFANLMLPLLV